MCHELEKILEEKSVTVKYAIHPVAGRMPGHMNVLLAEANVSYDKLYDLDQINPEFEQTDVALVIGANDVVNPAARHDKSSPIYGMPILDVDKSQTVFAKDTVSRLVAVLK
jgi:NAD(P) transhydrogenase subunit beta